jgi:hypothetical protein
MGTIGIAAPLLVSLSIAGDVLPAGPKPEVVATWLSRPVVIPFPIKQVTLEKALTLLADECDVVFDVDEIGFRKQGIRNILDRKVNLVAQNQTPLGEVLNQLARQIKGDYRVRQGLIEIVPLRQGDDGLRSNGHE